MPADRVVSMSTSLGWQMAELLAEKAVNWVADEKAAAKGRAEYGAGRRRARGDGGGA